jgi:hypothetical protein
MKRGLCLGVLFAWAIVAVVACKNPSGGASPTGSGSGASVGSVAAADSATLEDTPASTQDPSEPVSPDDEHKNASKDISKANYKAKLGELESELGK